MRRDVLIGIIASLLIHGSLALAGRFWPAAAEPAPAPPPSAPIEVMLTPPPEPEPVNQLEYAADAGGGPPSFATPQIEDTPAMLIESPFVQRLQPPPPPGLPPSAGLVTIPSLGGDGSGTGSGLGHLFDLAALDQVPVLTFQPQPIYPYDLRRSGVNGQVLIEFVVTPAGETIHLQVIRSSHQRFEDAALQALRRWRFRPGTKDGVAVSTRMQQLFSFNLEDSR